MTRICEYKHCDVEFEAKRSHGRFCSDRCRTLDWKENDSEETGERVPEHPLGEVRAEQEQVEAKARWTLLVREHMARTLIATGYFHSDDLDPLGIPEQHCNVAGSQSGAFVSRKLMVEVGRRASSKPSRKKAKSAIYRITEKGRTELSSSLIGPSADVAPEEGDEPNRALARLSTGPDESITEGRGQADPGAPIRQPTGLPAETVSGDASSGSLFDAPVQAHRPRSAFTDSEAA